MLSRQDQVVSENSQAIQANGDVVINNGLSSDQLIKIMGDLTDITSRLTKNAVEEVDRRLRDFREELIVRFTENSTSKASAFQDPDFQYMLGDAQTAYARSGDPTVRDTLIDIIARRSMAESSTREALALNEAAARAPRLTKAEFATLSLCYLIRYVHNGTPNDAETFSDYINRELVPFLEDASRENSSFWHLDSQSCASLGLAQVDLRKSLETNYGGLIGFGFSFEEAANAIDPARHSLLNIVLCPSVRNRNNLQPKAQNRRLFLKIYSNTGLTPAELETLWALQVNTIPPGDGLIEMLRESIPRIGELFSFWNETEIKSLELNSVGIAIAHANAVRVIGFNAPLNIWLK